MFTTFYISAFVLSLLFRAVQATGRKHRGHAPVPAARHPRASSSANMGAAAHMPMPSAFTAPAVPATSFAQQHPVGSNSSEWRGTLGRFASAAVCAVTAGRALGSSKRRRRRGGVTRPPLSHARDVLTVAEMEELPPYTAIGPDFAQMHLPAESPQFVRHEAQFASSAVATQQQLQHQLHWQMPQVQPLHPMGQIVAVAWVPIQLPTLIPVAAMDFQLIPTQQNILPQGDQDVPAHTAPSTSAPHTGSISKSDVAKAVEQLSVADSSEMQATLDWVIESAWELANTHDGSRAVQKAFDVARGDARLALLNSLKGHVLDALKSPYANYVLQKCIEVSPAVQLNFMTDELRGNAASAAKHRFGCRILERLIEHNCAELPTNHLIDEIVFEASSLCRHSFANFVIQHVLEHGSPTQKARIVEVLLPDICRLSKHRVASHVVQCALVYASSEDRIRLKQAMSADATELEDIRKTQCGRFVVQELSRV